MPILVALSAAYLLSQFYRIFLAVIAPELSADLNLDASDLGLISGIWFLTFAAIQIPVGMAFDRYGARRVTSLVMGLAVIGACGFAASWDATSALISMALIGCGCSPILAGAMWIIAKTRPSARFASLVAIIIGIGSTGNILAATPFALAAEALGWRGAMLAVAGLTAASLVAIRLVLPPDAPSGGAQGGLREAFSGVAEIFRIRMVWLMLPLFLFNFNLPLAIRGLWGGPYLDEVFGVSTVERGNILMAMALAMVISAFAYGPMDRWFNTRKGVIVTGKSIAAVGMILLGLFGPSSLTATVLLMVLIGLMVGSSSVLMAHARAFMPPHLTGRGITAVNMFAIGGGFLSQSGSGLFVEAARAAGLPPSEVFGTLFIALGVTMLLVLGVYLFARDAPPEKE